MTLKDEISSLNAEEKLSFNEDYSESKKKPKDLFSILFVSGLRWRSSVLSRKSCSGIIYTLFCWTLIPFFISIIQLFFTKKAVANYNEELSEEILLKIKANHVEEDISLPEVSVDIA